MNYGKYILKNLIGRGSFGKVYKAINSESNENVIVKLIKKIDLLKQTDINKIKREISIPTLIGINKNIVEVVDFFETKCYILIIYKYIEDGTDLFKKNFDLEQDLLLVLNILCQLVQGLKLMHEKNIVHGDIKPHNIILGGEVPVYIDFELASVLDSDKGYLNFRPRSRGTPNYLAPELWLEKKETNPFKADIYSLGCTFYYLCNHQKLPFKAATIEILKKSVLNLDPIPSSTNIQELDIIIMSMISKDPDMRPELDHIEKIILSLFEKQTAGGSAN